jgi:hypothetical protein
MNGGARGGRATARRLGWRFLAVCAALSCGASLITGADAAPLASAPVGIITGQVRAAATGSPLPGICLLAEEEGGSRFLKTVQSGPQGVYAMTGLDVAKRYTLFFSDCASHRYASQYWPNQPFGPGEGIAPPRTSVDVSLQVGATISGTLTDDDGILKASDVCVNTSPSVPWTFGSYSDSSGHYVIGPLAAASYKVDFGCGFGWPHNWYLEQWWNHKPDEASGDSITVVPGQSVVADERLPQPGVLSGTVTNAASGNPLPNICVTVSYGTSFGSRFTDSAGHWRLEGYPVNTPLTVQFNSARCGPPAPYVTQWWQNKASADQADTITFTNATPIISGVDAHLQPAT